MHPSTHPAAPSPEDLLRHELERERELRRQAEAELAACREQMQRVARSELYFRHLTEYSLDLITILDADGTIRFESRSVSRELGWAQEDYLGHNAFEFVHPDDAPAVSAAFFKALSAKGNTPVLSFRFRAKDGTYRILEGSGNNLLEDPAVAGIVFNSRDVTEKRRLEEQFLQSQKVQALGLLTGGVAHDFNNILTAILGYSDLASPHLSPGSEASIYLEEIRKAGIRAAALTRQLLAFSRKQVLEPRILDLEAVMRETSDMLRRILGEHIDMVVASKPDLGRVRADAGQIQQVLLNLAVNARDAMSGGGILTIETANVSLDANYTQSRPDVVPGDYVMLAMTDTGCGMSPEVMKRIFEPFFTTKEVGKGTGLGLATCYGIIKQSEGHLAAYSEPGQGTTFKVYLPRVEEQADTLPVAEEDDLVPTGEATVLLVEDEPMLRELGFTILSELGYQVFAADNGREALQVLEENPGVRFDLLMTDVVMPVMGGKELVDAFLPLSPHTKVVFCSGYTEEALFQVSGFAHAISFLQKPYTIPALARKVRDVLAL